MRTRLIAGLIVAMLMAPTMYAGGPPDQATRHFPWERLPRAAADALCKHLGLCFESMP